MNLKGLESSSRSWFFI